MEALATLQAQALVGQWKACGLQQVVLSPGSRSAPLVLAVEAAGGFAVATNPDERAAAFLALGLARSSNQPVLLLCSSGSAGLNMAPAVAEAFHQGIPLLIATADRPSRLLHTAEGQTMVQSFFYEGFIKNRFEPPEGEADWRKWALESWQACLEEVAGPVHLNLRFDEPLYGQEQNFLEPLPMDANPPKAVEAQPVPSLPDRMLVLAGQWPWAQAGSLRPALRQAIAQGLRFWGDMASHVWDLNGCGWYPEWLWQQSSKAFLPEGVLVLGGAMVPRRWAAFAEKHPEIRWYQVRGQGATAARFHPQTTWLDVPLEELLAHLAGRNWEPLPQPESLLQMPKGWHDLAAVAEVFGALLGHEALHLGNSMAIRYGSLLRHMLPQSCTVWCNRGLSGIDGTQSTACGHALYEPKRPQVILSGDLALDYDHNGWLTQPAVQNCRTVVLNNKGGQIFRHLAGSASAPKSEDLFATAHQRTYGWLAERHGWTYRKSKGKKAWALDEGAALPGLLELETEAKANQKAWREILDWISQQKA